MSTKEKSPYRQFWLGLLAFTIFMSLLVTLEFFWSAEIRAAMNHVADKFGFKALAVILFFCDWLVSPFPPDLILIIIARSHLRENFHFYVTILAFVSLIAGHAGWLCGRLIRNWKRIPLRVEVWVRGHQDMVAKYGFWAVVLGAMTPLPYSVTCWSAGFLGLSWRKMMLASLFRIPRVWIVYLLIHSTGLMN